jgi:hypothetical protein
VDRRQRHPQELRHLFWTSQMICSFALGPGEGRSPALTGRCHSTAPRGQHERAPRIPTVGR